ncbi:excinuclease ABC subunit UvrA [Nostoc sp. CHAB 5834]|nr:excinuclease ABC subunit UvrA [Nostoc sp. CHAB 5834]
MSLTHIKVRGAREHNLKGVDIDLPRDKLIVITGLSGSGKSSLAFDTIYAEGQRRYVESLSAYARQFLEMMQKPDVEHIEGLSPAISIEQKTTSRNPRSTVATVTEIYDYMRLLWARVGVPYSPATGLPITAQTVSQMVDRVMALPEGTRAFLLAPAVQGRKGEYRKELAEWQRSGYTRVRIDGEMYAIEEAPALDKKYKHDIEVVVDRIVVKDGIQQRLAESFEAALKLADGLAFVDLADGTVAELMQSVIPAEEFRVGHAPHVQGLSGGQSDPKLISGVGALPPETPAFAGVTSEGNSSSLAEARTPFVSSVDETPIGIAQPNGVSTMLDTNGKEKAGKNATGGAMKGTGLPANRIVFSEKFACPVSGFTIAEIAPRLFSFNAPQGACPDCDGLGERQEFDPQLVVPNEHLSLKKGAVVPWAKSNPPSPYYMQVLSSLAKAYDFTLDTPWEDLLPDQKLIILHGTGGLPVELTFKDGRKEYTVNKAFEGVIGNLNRRLLQTDSAWMREELSKYQTSQPCETCHGARLKPEALSVKIAGVDIATPTKMSVGDALVWFGNVDQTLTNQQQQIAKAILKEINERLGFLNNVGLDYLNLDRTSGTLSGGESQRIRLASQIGSGLSGVLYVLDEPSIGLHQKDNDRLLATLRRLRDLGNTVIVVEHDEDAIRTADWVVDLGPGAGVHGGNVMAEGTLKQILKAKGSLTADYLNGTREIAVPKTRRKGNKKKLTVHNARANNLKNVTASIPLGTFCCITGVSGSGKSSFTIDTLYASAARSLNGARVIAGAHDKITGLEHCDKVIDIDQSPIGRTPRSNPATYTGAFTNIRDWFAQLPESAARGYKPGRFSFNVKGGRCETCSGDGLIKIEMHFLPDVYVTCEECNGKRYNRETLEVKWKGLSIADVLDMTVEDAVEVFKAVPPIRDKMAMLAEVGLGYVKVGQQATTLSGGEAQRVKLAKELSRRSTGQTLYILDEPTTGLHFEDVRKLLEVLHRLVEQGNSVVVIEHNLDVIKTADWVIDLGPEGGVKGGEIVAEGTPEQVAKEPKSYTGHYLAPMLAKAK